MSKSYIWLRRDSQPHSFHVMRTHFSLYVLVRHLNVQQKCTGLDCTASAHFPRSHMALGWVPLNQQLPALMQSLVFDSEPEHDKRFYLPTSQYSKSIPPWPGSHWLKETMSLIKTGRGPANMAHPSFSQQRAERKEGGGEKERDRCASGAVASHGSSSLCSRSSLSFPWLCLSKERLNGQGSLCHSSLTRLFRGSHMTWTWLPVRPSPLVSHWGCFLCLCHGSWDWKQVCVLQKSGFNIIWE